MRNPRFLSGAARAGLRVVASLLTLAAVGGCSSVSPGRVFRGGVESLTFDPPSNSPAFRDLHLEKTPSIVILKIAGDDVRSNMMKVAEVLLGKGYAVRDHAVTLRTLYRARLLERKPTEPEVLKKAAELFAEEAAIAGSVEMVQAEPLRVFLALHWVDMKTQKVLWTAKATYSSYIFGGPGRYESAVREMIERALSAIPRAKP